MSVNNNSTYASDANHRVIRAVVNGYFQTHFLNRFHRLSAWLAHLRKNRHATVEEADFVLGNECFVKDGYHCISADQVRRERDINIKTTFLFLTYIR